jgi:ribonuclease BN (tRNA processing enzyme)
MGVGLKLTVLGCDGSYPGPGGATSGYLVQGAGTTVWVDAGSGTLANLQRHAPLDTVDAIVLTHEHPDHWMDLEGFCVAARYRFELPPVPVYSPAGLAARSYHGEDWLRWHVVGDGHEITVGAMQLRFSRTDHPPETLAVRIDCDGRSLGYSADSGPGWTFAALGEGVDLALCEATLPRDFEDSMDGHMSARQAGAAARAGGARSLLLTHLWPGNDRGEAQADGAAAFGGPCDVAETDHSYEV